MNSLFSVSGLSKAYGSTQALSGVDFQLAPGEVHALVGENGAGKSTLARIICGLAEPDSGSMLLDGQPYRPTGKREAEQHGVRIVMQELNLIPTLTVAESILMGHWPKSMGFVKNRELCRAADEHMKLVGLEGIKPETLIGDLSVGQQQLVEIAAGLSQQCKVLFLDEPTAALTDSEAELLFAQISRLKDQGVGIVYVSHRMEEIRRISDRITVLRDGQLVATKPISEVSLDDIVRLMVGRELGEEFSRGSSLPGETALRVDNLHRGPMVKDVSFEVRRGEILGFAGLMGSGRTETMRAIFGADKPSSGKVFVGGSTRPARIRSPKDAVRHGIALLTEDRKGQGLLLPLPISLNATLTSLRRISVFGFLQNRREKGFAKTYCDALNVKLASLSQPVGDLSGGNQQKVVIAKWLYRDCDVLLFDEPTRGIDVGAKLEIYHLLDALTKEGKAVVVVSSDLKELLAISDRIAVMSAGKLAATFNRGEWTQDAIMAAALSGHLGSVPERNENG